ncbi:MAG: precorrin-2 C(20)-methyltransferase [Roseitalea sp.]|nr:precorrin-2 C(20)-methyltransferase [Roseitalea sp.]MBO6721304.1 precorrin-2 C(20)-methyltransferase [Roseitalea sp.]MBO6742211.1 precorrin-2 C(20)-methyltransferase [Roseitalea sp.]
MTTGTLYGVGVGPGAPDLITLRAWCLLTAVPVIAWPAPDNGESFARSIVAGCIRADHVEIPIRVPMRTERFPAAEVYDSAASEIAAHLDAGRDVAVLCEGDPFFYGSFMYLFQRLSGRYRFEIVPGVSSVMAGGAAIARPLAARNEIFSVIPAPLDDERIEAQLAACDAAAIIKVGRHFHRIRALVDRCGLTAQSCYAERLTLEAQKLARLDAMPDEAAPYFSMILVYKGNEAWPSPVLEAGS